MKTKKAVRLTAKIDQIIILDSFKAIKTVVDRVYVHEDGRMTGNIRHSGKVFHVVHNSFKGVWEL